MTEGLPDPRHIAPCGAAIDLPRRRGSPTRRPITTPGKGSTSDEPRIR